MNQGLDEASQPKTMSVLFLLRCYLTRCVPLTALFSFNTICSVNVPEMPLSQKVIAYRDLSTNLGLQPGPVWCIENVVPVKVFHSGDDILAFTASQMLKIPSHYFRED